MLRFEEKWRFRLPKVRDPGSRTPCFSKDFLVHVFHYQKGAFYESALIGFDVGNGSEIWRFEEAHLLNSPHADNEGNIYISSFAGSVLCFGADGTQKWRTELRKCNMGDVLLLENGRLIVAEIAGGSRFLYCLDARTGSVIWTFEGGGHGYQLAYSGSLIFYPCTQNGPDFDHNYGVRLYGIDTFTGREAWHVHSLDWVFSTLSDNNVLWVGARGSVQAFDSKSGQQLDQFDLAPDEGVFRLLRTESGIAYFSENSNKISSLSYQSQRKLFKKVSKISKRWTAQAGVSPVSRFACFKRNILAVTNSGHVAVLDVVNGEICCKAKIFSSAIQSLALQNRKMAVASDREISLYEVS